VTLPVCVPVVDPLRVTDSPTKASAGTQDRELRTIDRDFARAEFQTALEDFVLKRRGSPPAAATEYRGAYGSEAVPDRIAAIGAGGDAPRH
jgi:hypothetical protein